MTPGGLALIAVSLVLLCAAGLWTERRYARFDELPAHYDFRGRATRLAPRRTMAWLLPGTFAFMIVGLGVLPPLIAGDPDSESALTGIVILCVGLLLAQGLVLVLQENWARSQP